MAPIKLSPRILTYLSIGISLVVHLLIINYIIFTFHARPATPEPTFVFWGSILPREDFQFSTKTKRQVARESDYLEPSLLLERKRGRIPKDSATLKPAYGETVDPHKKQTPKSTFDTALEDLRQKEQPDQILGIQLEVPKRIPLRMTGHD